MISNAMLELIGRFFGFNAVPDYCRTLSIFERDPYRPVRELLAQSWRLLDLTDNNSDLGFVYSLVDHPAKLTVRLSIVGPYALIVTDAGDSRKLVPTQQQLDRIDQLWSK